MTEKKIQKILYHITNAYNFYKKEKYILCYNKILGVNESISRLLVEQDTINDFKDGKFNFNLCYSCINEIKQFLLDARYNEIEQFFITLFKYLGEFLKNNENNKN